MIFLKIFIDLICGVLNSLGGWHILWMRRYLMPSVLAISSCIFIHSFWPLTMILCMAILCLGYKRFGSGNFSRGCWSFMVAATTGIGCLLSGHVYWFLYLPWFIGAGILGGTLVNLYQPVGDLIEGCWLGIILLFIK